VISPFAFVVKEAVVKFKKYTPVKPPTDSLQGSFLPADKLQAIVLVFLNCQFCFLSKGEYG
jgi:hypothetical protein